MTPRGRLELGRLAAAFQRDPGAHFVGLGYAYLSLSQPEEALRIGCRGLTVAPESLPGRLMLSEALARLGRWSEAEEQLRWIVVADPDLTEAQQLLADVVRQQRPPRARVDTLDGGPTRIEGRPVGLRGPRAATRREEPGDELDAWLLATERATSEGHEPLFDAHRPVDEPAPVRIFEPVPAPAFEPGPEPDVAPAAPARRAAPSTRRGQVLRFVLAERLLHWAIALPFVICMLTAALLVFYYNPDPTRPHRALVSWVHRGSGIAFIALPLLVILFSVRRLKLFWGNMKEAWGWSRDDFRWLLLTPLAMVSRRVKLPEEGKFNAGEKLNFMWTMVSWPAFAVSGLIIWLAHGIHVTPWLIHFSLAAASLPLIAGHIFMAVVNPGSRKGLSGMFTGYVDRSWAAHHYRKWFRDNFGALRAGTGSLMIYIGRKLSPVLVVLALFGVGLAAAVTFVVWPHATAGTAATQVRYLAGDSPLWSAPAEDEPPVAGGSVVRGSELTWLYTSGEFARVRDSHGREGYVFATDLLAERPRFSADSFAPAACARDDGEADAADCRARAEAKLELCRLDCDAAEEAACQAQCQAGFQGCAAACAEVDPAPDAEAPAVAAGVRVVDPEAPQGIAGPIDRSELVERDAGGAQP